VGSIPIHPRHSFEYETPPVAVTGTARHTAGLATALLNTGQQLARSGAL